MNTQEIVNFFSEVIRHGGFILSADTCNPKHIGPKLMGFVKEFSPTDWEDWLTKWGDYYWGTNEDADSDAYSFLFESLEELTNWACQNVTGMASESHVYQFGFSEYDGALLGWWRYPIEE